MLVQSLHHTALLQHNSGGQSNIKSHYYILIEVGFFYIKMHFSIPIKFDATVEYNLQFIKFLNLQTQYRGLCSNPAVQNTPAPLQMIRTSAIIEKNH